MSISGVNSVGSCSDYYRPRAMRTYVIVVMGKRIKVLATTYKEAVEEAKELYKTGLVGA